MAEGVTWIGAFDVETGRAVRAVAGPDVRIFVWLLGGADDLAGGIAADLDLGIGDEALLADLAAHETPPSPARVHLKIDTGLHRNGIRPEDWSRALETLSGLVGEGKASFEGLWSHIAEASDADDDDAREIFLAARAAAIDAGLTPRFSHLAASAAGFARAPFREDLVRVGRSLTASARPVARERTSSGSSRSRPSSPRSRPWRATTYASTSGASTGFPRRWRDASPWCLRRGPDASA